MVDNWTDNSGYTYIELYPNGKYKSFVPVTDTEWMIGTIIVTLKSEMKVQFYDDGGIEFCFLAEPATFSIFGTPVTVASGKVLEFYNNGNFRALTLNHQKRWFWQDKFWHYRRRSYNPGTTLRLSASGDVIDK